MKVTSKYNKVIFFHIFKTGGTSLIRQFEEIYHKAEIAPYHQSEQIYNINKLELEKYNFFYGHFYLYDCLKHIDEKAFIFTYLRNPVDSVLSRYFHFREEGKKILERHGDFKTEDSLAAKRWGLSLDLSFEEFITLQDKSTDLYIENHVTKMLIGDHNYDISSHTKTQETINIALKAIQNISFIGVTELYSLSVQQLNTCLFDKPHVLKNIKERVSPERKNHSYPKGSAIDTILKRNFIDIILYNYAVSLLTACRENINLFH